MGQGVIKKQRRLNGYEQKKAKMELEKKRKKAEKLAKKGIIITRADNWADRKAAYKEWATAHKNVKQGGQPIKREKGMLFTPGQRAAYARKQGAAERREIKKIRNWLIQTQGMRCAICGLPITKEEDCTVDHIIPKCQGGRTTRGNCQLAHKLCNLLKDNNVSEKKLDN